MSEGPDRLYALLPAVHRRRDAERGEPLRALLGILQEEYERVHTDIGQLYDNWFIETCQEWVVPYLGDLIGARHLTGVSGRALVANLLSYRARKGTLQVLESLARDVTGWPAYAV